MRMNGKFVILNSCFSFWIHFHLVFLTFISLNCQPVIVPVIVLYFYLSIYSIYLVFSFILLHVTLQDTVISAWHVSCCIGLCWTMLLSVEWMVGSALNSRQSWNQILFPCVTTSLLCVCMIVAWLITLSVGELGTCQRMDSLPSSSLPSVMVSHTSKSKRGGSCAQKPFRFPALYSDTYVHTHTYCHTVSQIDKQGQRYVKAGPIMCSFTFAHTCTLGRHLSGHLSVRWLSAPWQPSVHLHSNGELKCSVPAHAAHVYGTMQNQSACVVLCVPVFLSYSWSRCNIMLIVCFNIN